MDRSPANLDRRSLELHRLIAARLRERPDLLAMARNTLERWRRTDPRGCPGWDQWAAALDAGPGAALGLMLDPGERGQYLRSCTPFTRILSARERADFLRRWNAIS